MSEVNTEQRQKAKTAAANAVVVANDTAVVLGGAGIIVATVGGATGLGAPAGLLVGGILGIGSFAAWAIGNRYQRLANDPPEGNEEVTFSAAQLVEGVIPAAEPQATVIRYAANQLILADAMSAMITSLERFDGAMSAGDVDTANAQAQAVQVNANLVVSAHSALVDLAPVLNKAWSALIIDVDTSGVAFAAAPNFLIAAIQTDSEASAAVTACITGRADDDPFAELDPSDHPLLVGGRLPPTPTELISGAFNSSMIELSDPLASITNNA